MINFLRVFTTVSYLFMWGDAAVIRSLLNLIIIRHVFVVTLTFVLFFRKEDTETSEEINSFYSDETSIESILGYELVNEFIKPNIIFDKDLTEKNQKEQLDRVSRFQGTVLANELIVDANNRITESVLLKLKSLHLSKNFLV